LGNKTLANKSLTNKSKYSRVSKKERNINNNKINEMREEIGEEIDLVSHASRTSRTSTMIRDIDPLTITFNTLKTHNNYHVDALKKLAKAYSIKITGDNGRLLKKDILFNKI